MFAQGAVFFYDDELNINPPTPCQIGKRAHQHPENQMAKGESGNERREHTPIHGLKIFKKKRGGGRKKAFRLQASV